MATLNVGANITWSGHISSQDADSWAQARNGIGDSIVAWIGSTRGAIVSHWLADPNYYFAINRGFYSFDTSPLSGKSVVSVDFQLKWTGQNSNYSGAGYSDTHIYGGGQHCPLVSGDWNAFGDYIDEILYADLLAEGAIHHIVIPPGLINTEGTTKLALKISSDADNLDIGGGPGEDFIWNSVGWYVGGAKLVITYILIFVLTMPASDILAGQAVLNGNLVNDGGAACDCGFQWGETTTYGNTTPTQSRTTGQSFLQEIIGLGSTTIYHFRAFATGAAGTAYGEDEVFITPSASESVDETVIGHKVSLEAIRNIEIVYGGRFYIGKSGNAIYESRYHRNV